jgi:hypothetical protein
VLTNQGYVVGGRYNGIQVWAYDPTTNQWSRQMDFLGVPREGCIGFAIGTKGYVGFGSTGSPLNDLWEFTPVAQ